jgi:hypothetical protein
MVPNRDRYQSTFFEKGESLSLGVTINGGKKRLAATDLI